MAIKFKNFEVGHQGRNCRCDFNPVGRYDWKKLQKSGVKTTSLADLPGILAMTA